MEQNGKCSDMLVAHWFLAAAWIEKLLSSDVSKGSSRTWALCSVSGVEVRNRTKAEPIDFSNTACHSQLIVFLLLKLSFRSYMTSHHNPPHFNMLPFQQSLRDWCIPFPSKKTLKKHPFSLWMLLCVTMWDVSGQAIHCLLLFTLSFMSQYSVCKTNSFFNSWLIENRFYYSLVLTRLCNCLRVKRSGPVYPDSVWVSRDTNEERCLLTKKIFIFWSLFMVFMLTHKAYMCPLICQFLHTQGGYPPWFNWGSLDKSASRVQ